MAGKGGYETPSTPSADPNNAPMKFKITCEKTKPGQGVFVVGSAGVLGEWKPGMALSLATSAEEFPVWTSEVVYLPGDSNIDFKLVIQAVDRTGSPDWEVLHCGNRMIKPDVASLNVVSTSWGSAKVECRTEARPSFPICRVRSIPQSEKAKASARQSEERTLVKIAEASSEQASLKVPDDSAMGKTLSQRDRMKRNFSQTLLNLDIEADKDQAIVGENGGNVQKPIGSGMGERVSSFSALEMVMPSEEKEAGRKSGMCTKTYAPKHLDVPVVVVTSEVAPWSKSGGLGQVAGSYRYEFPRSGHRTMIVAPKYKNYEGLSFIGETTVFCNGSEQVVKYLHKKQDGADCIFVEHPSIQKPDEGLYNGKDGSEYPDNLFRFTLLSLAALEAPLILKLDGSTYGDRVLFLANDWQAGLVPFYLCHKYRPHATYSQARAIFMVHNIAYQGLYHGYDACSFFGINSKAGSDLQQGNCINLCKGALICADRIIAVSPNYVHEIQTPELGFGLQDFTRAKAHALRLAGILNGIDDAWNPEIDKNLVRNYSVEDFDEGKAVNKMKLQEQLGLLQDSDRVLIGFVGRLAWQKGVDVIGEIIEWLMKDTGNGVNGYCQLIMMGNGEAKYAETLRWAQRTYPGLICGYVGFDAKIEHRIMAGCDLFLMPSRYEPCGLPQMYSMRYGTLPIVNATGGLKDTVRDISDGPGVATGFQIEPLAADKMKETVYRAAELYIRNREQFRCMQRNGMLCDFYWPRAMDEYERHIDFTLTDPPTAR